MEGQSLFGRVLVVDDDAAICGLIGDILEGTGLRTVCARTDIEAYAALPTLPTFKAILLDINLGKGTTGFDIARFARQVIPGISVIYISGQASPTSFGAFGVPDSAFLEKPFKADQLLDLLQARLSANQWGRDIDGSTGVTVPNSTQVACKSEG